MKKGKAYAHRFGNRPGDLYDTPKSLIWSAFSIIKSEFKNGGSISQELEKYNYSVQKNDLYVKNKLYENCDYLYNSWVGNKYIITNPPFSLWDEFVLKAKTHCKKFMFIGRLNYLATQSRVNKGIWNNLKGVYPFSREKGICRESLALNFPAGISGIAHRKNTPATDKSE